MGTHACRRSALQGDEDLGSLKDRIEILERLLLSEVPEEQRKAVESDILERKRDAGESEQLERERERLRKSLQSIYDARSILKKFIEQDAVYVDERDGLTYVIRDGRTLHVGAPYGFWSLSLEASAGGLKNHKDLMDTKLLERRLDDWYEQFDVDEIVKLNARIDELSQAELDKLAEDLEGRLERFHKGYAGKDEAGDGGEG